MVLVGQYDSPFVRRVAVAMHYFGISFERKVLSTFRHFDEMLKINPLGKVPVLELPNGERIFDSRAIIEYLDGLAAPDVRLVPADESLLRNMLRIEAVGIGLAEKVYERGIEFSRKKPSQRDPDWIARLDLQIATALEWLEKSAQPNWLVGDRLSRADLAVVVAVTYAREKLPDLFDVASCPDLEAYGARLERLGCFANAPYSRSEAINTGWRPETPSDETE